MTGAIRTLAKKVCAGCGQLKPVEEFSERRSIPGSRIATCHACVRRKKPPRMDRIAAAMGRIIRLDP